MKVSGLAIVSAALFLAIGDRVLSSASALNDEATSPLDGAIASLKQSPILACFSGSTVAHVPSASAPLKLNFSDVANNPIVACLATPAAGSTPSSVVKPTTNPLLNVISGIIANASAPISGIFNHVGQLNVTNIPSLDPLTNLTGESLADPVLSILRNLTVPILDPATNLTASVNLSAPIVSPALNTLRMLHNGTSLKVPALGSLDNLIDPLINLTDILGMLDNLTSPLQAIFGSNLTFYTNVSVTISLNIPPFLALPSIFSPIPNTVTVMPVGMTKFSFYIYSFQEKLSTVPVTFTIPAISYLSTKVSDTATVALSIPTGSIVAIMGLTKPRLYCFPGLAWQTFPQLTKVAIFKLVPGCAHMHPLHNLTIPSLICKSHPRCSSRP